MSKVKPLNLDKITVTFSIADYCFERTRSIGQMNLALGLVQALAERPEIARLVILSNDTIKLPDFPHNVAVKIHNEANGRGFKRILWDQFLVYKTAERAGTDWLFLPKGFTSFVYRPKTLLASYIHDAVPDYYKRKYPECFNRIELFYFNRAMQASIEKADLIFTNSEFVISEVIRLCKQWRISKVAPMRSIGAGFLKRQRTSGEKSGRLFVLTSVWKHKRTDLAVKYLSMWQQKTGFSGGIDWVGSLPEGLTLPNLPGWKHYTRLPEDVYRKMFSASAAVIYFSEYEGFGMPPIEAILEGVCPVYSDIPATREVMGGVGAPFNNDSFEDFCRALNFALTVSEEEILRWENILLQRHNWMNKAKDVVNAMLEVQQGRAAKQFVDRVGNIKP